MQKFYKKPILFPFSGFIGFQTKHGSELVGPLTILNPLFVLLPVLYQISNIYYTRVFTLTRVTSGGLHLTAYGLGYTAPKIRRSRWQHCVQFNRPGIRAPELPHQ